MYTIIICIVIFLIAGFVFKNRHGLDIPGTIAAFSSFGFLLGFVVSFFIGLSMEYDEATLTRTRPIVSMGSTSSTEGNFVIGSGNVTGVDYFYYYAVLEDGSIAKGRRKSVISFIFEGHDQPRIEEYSLTTSSNFAFKSKAVRYEFYVPHGTVIREFNLK
jgi:hypothetical protein